MSEPSHHPACAASETSSTSTLNRPEVRNALQRAADRRDDGVGRGARRTDPDAARRRHQRRRARRSARAPIWRGWRRWPATRAKRTCAMRARPPRCSRPSTRCPCRSSREIHGAAIGGGAGLAAVADIAVAEESATFGFTEVKLGLIPAVIAPYVLAKIGQSAARELFVTGRRFDAAHAREIGLVHAVVPPIELIARCSSTSSRSSRTAAKRWRPPRRCFAKSRTVDRRRRAADRRGDRRAARLGGGAGADEGVFEEIERSRQSAVVSLSRSRQSQSVSSRQSVAVSVGSRHGRAVDRHARKYDDLLYRSLALQPFLRSERQKYVDAIFERSWLLRLRAVPANIAEGFGQQSDRQFAKYLLHRSRFVSRSARASGRCTCGRKYLDGTELGEFSGTVRRNCQDADRV